MGCLDVVTVKPGEGWTSDLNKAGACLKRVFSLHVPLSSNCTAVAAFGIESPLQPNYLPLPMSMPIAFMVFNAPRRPMGVTKPGR
jgi:hypothetical protein